MTTPLGGARLARVRSGTGTVRVGTVIGAELHLLSTADVLAVLRGTELPVTGERIALLDVETCAVARPWTLLEPVAAPETWAAGVTYRRSRDARIRESQTADVYDLIYEADRPELFMKDANGRRTVGPGRPIGVRADATWTVPEPELAVVLGVGGEPVAVTIGNDVSARDIEGANPLYLPQAKIYANACALGPVLLVPEDWNRAFEIELRVLSPAGDEIYSGSASTSSMRRSIDELVAFLLRDNPVPPGSVLLTGTGVVPPDEFTLSPGQMVEIHVPGIGTLTNVVAEATRNRNGV